MKGHSPGEHQNVEGVDEKLTALLETITTNRNHNIAKQHTTQHSTVLRTQRHPKLIGQVTKCGLTYVDPTTVFYNK